MTYVDISVNAGKSLFYYIGNILEEHEDYILLDENDKGVIRVYKAHIISLKVIKE